MPPRSHENDSFIDKLLGLFGIRKPKKRKAVSRRKSNDQNSHRKAQDFSNKSVLPLSDDFQIISDKKNKNQQQYRYVEEPRRNVDYMDNSNRPDSKVKTGVGKNGKIKKRHPVLRALLSVFLVMVITCCLIASAGLFYIFAFVDGTVEDNLDNLKLDYTSILYAEDNDGNQVELTRLHGTQNRLWVDLSDMPKYIQGAYISCEDKRFLSHSGVDWKRTFSAMVNMVFKFYSSNQGGSTITQQLVKNLTSDDAQTPARKIREIMRARYLEKKFTKEVILECYLNTIHLGNGVDGVEVASNYYFDKNVSDITLVQAACLASITKSPNDYDPYTHPDANKSRRNWVLSEMYKNGYITEAQCEKAQKADLGLRKKPSTVLSTTKTVDEEYNSYFVDAVIDDVVKGLVSEKGYTKEYAENQLYKGGYKIFTTVDLDMQNKLEAVYENEDNFMTVYSKSGDKAQSAMTIMDYEGHIKAIVGGRGEKKGNRVLNRATQSPRQSGSSIKPISAYAPAIEYNTITWGSSMEDSGVTSLNSGEKLAESWPKNYDGRYHGKVSILYALQQSLNTIPVKLVQDIGVDTAYDFVTKKMGISTFVEKDSNGNTDKCESSLGLGGSVKGVTTVEMAAAFSTFGNGGTYYEPTTYTKILDQKDDVIIDTKSEHHRAISEGTAGVMCELLQTVATSGTGQAAQFGNWPIMCKTGSTSDYKDRWFVGGTPHYMAACWFGLDNSQAMSGMYMNPAIILWKAAMEEVHKDLDLTDFADSDKVEYRKYCLTSGMCARTGCYNVGYGYFKSSYTPFCTYHGGDECEALDKPTPIGSETSSDNDNSSNDNYYEYNDNNSNNDENDSVETTAKTKVTSVVTSTSSNSLETDNNNGDEDEKATTHMAETTAAEKVTKATVNKKSE